MRDWRYTIILATLSPLLAGGIATAGDAREANLRQLGRFTPRGIPSPDSGSIEREANLRRFGRFTLGMTPEVFLHKEAAANCKSEAGAVECDRNERDGDRHLRASGVFVDNKLISLLIFTSVPEAVDQPQDTIAGAIRDYGPPDEDSVNLKFLPRFP